MNRRNFLKSLVTACGAAVVIPAVLLKARKKPVIVPRQNLTITELIASGRYKNWPKYYAKYDEHYDKEEFIKKFRAAFRNTKFKRPVPYGIRGDRSRFFYICQEHLRHGTLT